MQSITYQLDVSELDNRLIDSIKSMFKNGRLNVTVTTENNSARPIHELETIIERNRKSNVHYVFDGSEFDEVAEKLLNDEPVDFEKYKRTKQ